MTETRFIYADFMKNDFENRLVLTCLGTFRDLAKYDITLRDGMKLSFYNEDEDELGNKDNLVVQGIVKYDKIHERWIAIINWDKIKNVSKLSIEEKEEFGLI
ncbi:MAG: hypothetical protein ACR2N3_01865 [Pyrinomonadaceae bacterium]